MQARKIALWIAVGAAVVLVSAASAQGTFPGQANRADWLKANGLFDEGYQLFQAKKYALAVAKYKQAIAIYPGDFHYYLNLGLAQKKQGDLNGACQAFREGTTVNTHDWRLWKGLGNCLYQTAQFMPAKDAFEQALNCRPPVREVQDLNAAIAACKRSKR